MVEKGARLNFSAGDLHYDSTYRYKAYIKEAGTAALSNTEPPLLVFLLDFLLDFLRFLPAFIVLGIIIYY